MTHPFDDYDYSTKAGAQRLADRLNAFWHAKGHTTVAHWIEPVRFTRATKRKDAQPLQDTTWTVRSNLVRGLPPKEDVNATTAEQDLPRSGPTSRTAAHNPNTTTHRSPHPNQTNATAPNAQTPPPPPP